MQLSPRAVCAVFLGTLCAHGTVTSAEVHFEKETVVPEITTAPMRISPDGQHTAYLGIDAKDTASTLTLLGVHEGALSAIAFCTCRLNYHDDARGGEIT